MHMRIAGVGRDGYDAVRTGHAGECEVAGPDAVAASGNTRNTGNTVNTWNTRNTRNTLRWVEFLVFLVFLNLEVLFRQLRLRLHGLLPAPASFFFLPESFQRVAEIE